MFRKALYVSLVAVAVAACSGNEADTTQIPDLPPIDAAGFEALLAGLETPAVVNVWASWCGPCRSEAPLLTRAYAEHGDVVTFIGIDVQDSQQGAKMFLAEYDLDFDHYFDRDRSVPNSFGAFGTPITMFFAAHGELMTVHNGVIDERTLALNIDELTSTGS